MTPIDHTAYIAHRAKRRLRLKFPGRRNDRAWFTALRQSIITRDDVTSVRVNPLTASVCVLHLPTFDAAGLCRELTRSPQWSPASTTARAPVSAVVPGSCASLTAKVGADLASTILQRIMTVLLGRVGVPVESRPVRFLIALVADAVVDHARAALVSESAVRGSRSGL